MRCSACRRNPNHHPTRVGLEGLPKRAMRWTWRRAYSPGRIPGRLRYRLSNRRIAVPAARPRHFAPPCRCSYSISTEPAGTWTRATWVFWSRPRKNCAHYMRRTGISDGRQRAGDFDIEMRTTGCTVWQDADGIGINNLTCPANREPWR